MVYDTCIMLYLYTGDRSSGAMGIWLRISDVRGVSDVPTSMVEESELSEDRNNEINYDVWDVVGAIFPGISVSSIP